ncbi:ATP-binding protein [uncultured Thiodictyon sp.]|jgi:hypothetical protein|uniref:AAA family ATPase n=1 Tax=uncultured Thiodictyon sp. TaxID=1846217 RepID=UPI0025D540B6|nr:ATP-binding protein [uncultured Thiodictyon sp.]
MNEELPYAPRRKRPLSLWNPLDYLVLLYWAFYFPQAIRWYVERFGTLPWDTNGWVAIRRDRVQRRLAAQSIGGVAIALGVAWLVATGLEISLSWSDVSVGVVAVVLGGVASGEAVGVAVGVAFGVAGAVAGVVSFGVAGEAGAVPLVVANVVAIGVAMGVVGGGPLLVVTGRVALVGVLGGLVGGVLLGEKGGVAFGVANMVFVTLALFLALFRMDTVALAFLPAWHRRSRRIAITIQRVSLVPVPGLSGELYSRLTRDWLGGLDECEGLLRYTLQFAPVVEAANRALASTEGAALLSRISQWCERDLHDWEVIRFQSASLSAGLRSSFWVDLWVLPARWRPKVDCSLRTDTPARAASAGFWLLHKARPSLAADAFAQVRHLPFGEEMHANSSVLATALGCEQLQQIAAWLPPTLPGPDRLRPAVAQCLVRLGETARDAHLVLHSRSPRERSSALNRVIGNLKALQSTPNQCPQPERVVLVTILDRWMDLAQHVAADVGTLEAREPVASPYIVGAPVPADRLVGRESVFEQIRAAWAKPGQRDSLLVYGHRRMGKTSVMRNVLEYGRLGPDTGLAYLTLQLIDPALPLADLCQAIASQLWRASGRAMAEPQGIGASGDAQSLNASPLAELRDFFERLHEADQRRRYILVLDEYEVLDQYLTPSQAGAFVALLRGLTQQYPWLVVALVGLHRLKERSASLYEPIYAWRSVRVSFLDANGVADVLQVDTDAFPLAFSPECLASIHRLTAGQPFLVQLLGDRLVDRFNRRLREEVHPPPATFSAQDVEAIVADPSLYARGAGYFRGIWAQAGEGPTGQQALLRALAPDPAGLAAGGLAHASGLADAGLDEAIGSLIDHDVVERAGERYRYAVELMRRWVAGGWMERDDAGG